MIRGTTPIHTFEIPFDVSLIKSGKVVYSQNGQIILDKPIHQCALDGNTITLKLTQEETFLFGCTKGLVSIQVRLLTTDEEAIASDEMTVDVKRCLDNEVLV